MKKYIYNSDAQIRLLCEIFGDKAIADIKEKNRKKRKTSIQKALHLLPENQREVILYQYGFADKHTHTSEQTAEHLEISQEEAKHAEALALRTLRSPACSKGLRKLLLML